LVDAPGKQAPPPNLIGIKLVNRLGRGPEEEGMVPRIFSTVTMTRLRVLF